MSAQNTSGALAELTNGPGAAAVLAAGIGAFLVAPLDIAADKVAAIKTAMNLYRPTGPLSGVTTIAIFGWLVSWAILDWRWGKRNVRLGRVSTAALALLILSLLLTFPPFADLL